MSEMSQSDKIKAGAAAALLLVAAFLIYWFGFRSSNEGADLTKVEAAPITRTAGFLRAPSKSSRLTFSRWPRTRLTPGLVGREGPLTVRVKMVVVWCLAAICFRAL
jgi:hypothetical protein